MEETLIAFGESIKTVEETDDSYKFGAFLVVFDSPDISNMKDSFTKSTDFGFEDGETRPLLYNHGLDTTVGKAVIGKARLYLKDAGVWMEGEVKKRKDYLEKHIDQVGKGLTKTVNLKGIDAPMFGTSSGATPHAVIRTKSATGHEIKQWFIGEASITPTPAEPQTACMSLKSLAEMEVGQGISSVQGESEFKAVYLGAWIEKDMAMAGLNRLNDALMYRVVSSALAPSNYPMYDDGPLSKLSTMTVEERKDVVKAAFDEFQVIALDLIGRAMDATGDEAAKSLREAYKTESNEDIPLGDMSLVKNLQKLLVANEGLYGRMENFLEMRATSRKSDYVMPQDKISGLKSFVSGMEAVAAKGHELIGRYEKRSDEGEKGFDSELLELELRFRKSEFEAVL